MYFNNYGEHSSPQCIVYGAHICLPHQLGRYHAPFVKVSSKYLGNMKEEVCASCFLPGLSLLSGAFPGVCGGHSGTAAGSPPIF